MSKVIGSPILPIVNGNQNFEGGTLQDSNKDNGTSNTITVSPDPKIEGDKNIDVCDSTDKDDVKDTEDKLRIGCRSKKRLSHRHRRKHRSTSGVFVKGGEELTLENVVKQTRLAASSSTPFTGTLTNKLSFRGTGKCKSPTSSTIFNNILAENMV